ncbi:MAG: NAD(P)-dependent oxidoreductase [Phycisphaeraceae bacterium]|nr:MAG: NAD(P)-dependent oxidoreductase [Phycisphaeraceae bacterium]
MEPRGPLTRAGSGKLEPAGGGVNETVSSGDLGLVWAMIIALTGSSGFIGSAAARVMHAHGHSVTALVRPTSRREHFRSFVERFVEGDQADPGIWPELLQNADAVVHNSIDWAPLQSGDVETHLRRNLLGSLLLLQAAHEAGVKRFVFISSVATHHDISPRWEGVIDEDHPLRPSGLYGACKAAVEAHLWSAHYSWGMHTVALRPCAVYGVEPVRLERSHGYKQVRKLLDGEKVSKQDFPGGGKFVHVDDVALAIVRAVERDEASGRAFNLADCYAKHTLLGKLAAEQMGLDPAMVELDEGPPAKNMFSKEATREILGVELERGEAGLRDAMGELIAAVSK